MIRNLLQYLVSLIRPK